MSFSTILAENKQSFELSTLKGCSLAKFNNILRVCWGMWREVWKQHYLLLREDLQGEVKLLGIDTELLIISGGK